MVWYGMVWYGMVWYGMVWYGMVYGMVWYMVWYGIMYLLAEWEGRTGNIWLEVMARPNSVNKHLIIWPSRFFFQSFVFLFFPWEGQRFFSFARIFK